MTAAVERWPSGEVIYRTAEGHPIPYVADWSGEQVERIRFEPTLRQYAVFSAGCRGRGKPILGKMNPMRQREAMVRGLCQVCKTSLDDPADERAPCWGVNLHSQDATTSGDATAAPLLLEPFACMRCLALSLRVCPGLGRAARIEVLRVMRFELVLTFIKPVGKLARCPQPPGPIVSYVKALCREYESLAVEEFLRIAGVNA